ncbi:DUF4012 domain-containing protein [Microbacterium sp. NPDC096154]|uniref:DUF4012 domain-containing protein n=1 Tax=Microbacterium sp. NPDC096154 TaxID=3155549 RepID=UPI003324ECC6
MTRRSRSRSRKSAARFTRARAGRLVTVLLLLVLALTVFAVVWVGARGALAQWHLGQAQAAASTLQRIAFSDPQGAQKAADDLAENAAEAHELTSDPVWRAVEIAPWIGPQLRAASTLAASLNDAVGAVTPLVDVLATFDPSSLTPQDGRIELSPLIEAREEAATAAQRSRAAADAAAAVDTTPLLGALREPVVQGTAQLQTVADLTDALRKATVLLPAMLGADGPRDYLLIFQNNAEWRSLGGIAGNVAVLHTDGGRITLTDQASATSLGAFAGQSEAMPADARRIVGNRVETYMHNVTQVPDFHVTAELAKDLWQRERGLEVDGVIAVDPVAVSYLLDATGPVEMRSGDVLTAENTVPLLLNEVYFRYEDPQAQDLLFADATSSVFAALTNGAPNPSALISALGRGASENRLLLWSGHADEQQLLDTTTLAGALPESDAETARFGVYVNDATGSKLDYYMRLSTGARMCATTARNATATVRVQVQSEVPDDVASLPRYITGLNEQGTESIGGVPAGLTRTVAYVYLPEGGRLVTQNSSSGESLLVGEHDGRQVLSWWNDVPPGGSATLDISVVMPLVRNIDILPTPTYLFADFDAVDIPCGFPE